MDTLQFQFNPLFPDWAIWSLVAALLVFSLFSILQRQHGSLVRSAAAALLALALFNPSIIDEERTPLPTIIPVVVDETTSNKLDDRSAQTQKTLAAVREKLANLDSYEIREIRVKDDISDDRDRSSSLFSALKNGVSDAPKDQLGGAVFITDGQIHDVPGAGRRHWNIWAAACFHHR